MRRIFLVALLAISTGAFGADNYWNGSSGSWADGTRWSLGHAPGGNSDYARITSGTSQIISSPAGTVARFYLSGSSGANLEISADAQFKDIYMAESGKSGTITQTGGNVVFSGNSTTHLGRYGAATYNLSGGTLTHNSTYGADTHTFIGVYSGAVGTFNQTGGTFTKNGTVQQNIVVGYDAGAKGVVNLSGGTFHEDVGDEMNLGHNAGSEGYLNVSGTAEFRVGDGTGVPAIGEGVGPYDEPANGWGILHVGRKGYGKVVQTGGSVEANYIKIGNYTTGLGDYVISGGSLDLHAYLYIPEAGSFMVRGSGADHIRMKRFVPNYQFVGIELDADGSTLIEVDGVDGDRYKDARANARWQANTLPGFNGQVGDKYDVLWSTRPITDTTYNWSGGTRIESIGTALFDMEIAATNGGEMLRFVMTGTKANAVVWSGTGNWMDSSHWTDVAPSPDWTIPGSGPLNEGEALIRSGEVGITAASNPDSPVARMDLGGSAGATLNITGGDVEFKDVTLAEAGQVATVNQSGGNVLLTGNDRAYIGRYGHGIYNLSDGTLTHTSESGADCNTFIGVDRGSMGIFNQTGGTFIKNGSVQQNIYVGYSAKAVGILNLSGGEFRHEVGDDFILGHAHYNGDLARGYLNLSGTALFQIGDGGATPSGEPAGGWGRLSVGNEGYGEINQTGGTLDTEYIFIANSTSTGKGLYTISGGSVDVHRYISLVNTNAGFATMAVAGSGASQIRMSRFSAVAGTTLNLQLDANGTTLMEVYGTSSDTYRGVVLRGTVAVDTLASFNAPSGTVFDVIWSADYIETTSMTFINHSDFASFSWQVVAKDGGQMLQLVVTSARTPLDLWGESFGLTGASAAPSADPDGDGRNNLYEFGFGGDPTDPFDAGISPSYSLVKDGGATWMDYAYPKRSDPNSGLAYHLEINDDLVFGQWTNSGYAVTGTGTIDSDFDAVTNRVSTSGEESRFIRLSVEGSQNMGVVDFNILGVPTEGYEEWDQRCPHIADTLIASGAGIVGLQEMRYRDIADYFKQALGAGGYTAFPSSNLGIQVRGTSDTVLPDGLRGRHWQNNLYYKTGAFEQLDGGQQALYEGEGIDFFSERSITWLKLRHIHTGRVFVAIATHLDPHESARREYATVDLKNFIQSFPPDLPIVLVGDFNAQPGTPEIQTLVGDGTLKNVVERSAHIDYVMQRNFPGFGRGYEYQYFGDMKLSDHPMLTAEFGMD